MLERIAEIVTNSTPAIIGAVLLGSLAVAVLIDLYRKFNPPKDRAGLRARDEGEAAVVSALGALMSGAFYFATDSMRRSLENPEPGWARRREC